MLGHQGPVVDGGAVDVDGPALLLPGLKSFIHSLLFGDDGFQGVGHLLELLLVRVVEFVHPLDKPPVYDVIAVDVLGGCLMYHGDDFSQEGELFILSCGSHGCRGDGIGGRARSMPHWSGLLVFLWWREVGPGVPQSSGTAAEVVVFHVDMEPAFGADPLSLLPVCTGFARV